MLARPWRVIATGILFLSLAVLVQPAGAQLVNPFSRDATGMGAEDLALMREALLKALEAEKEGEVTSWRNDRTGRAGRVVVQRTFTRSDMPCAEVLHRFTSGGAQSYVLPFCRTPEGSWKLAF